MLTSEQLRGRRIRLQVFRERLDLGVMRVEPDQVIGEAPGRFAGGRFAVKRGGGGHPTTVASPAMGKGETLEIPVEGPHGVRMVRVTSPDKVMFPENAGGGTILGKSCAARYQIGFPGFNSYPT